MPKDLNLKTLAEIVAKTGIESDVMYEIEPTVIATKDGSGAVAIMAGWFDGYLCVLALTYFGASAGMVAEVYYQPDAQTPWAVYTTTPAGSNLKRWMYENKPVIAALHRAYMSVPARYFETMQRRAQHENAS